MQLLLLNFSLCGISVVAQVSFAQSTFTAVEEAGNAVVVVSSSGENSEPVVISYTIQEHDTQGTHSMIFSQNWYNLAGKQFLIGICYICSIAFPKSY